jgi:hypothetical protein
VFSVIVAGNDEAWEGAQPYRMDATRFNEYSESDGDKIEIKRPMSLRRLNGTQAVLLYEHVCISPANLVARGGTISRVTIENGEMVFRFADSSRTLRDDLLARDILRLKAFELSRTHWAIKNGHLPEDIAPVPSPQARFDVLLSYASEQRDYVRQVSIALHAKGVEAFFDQDFQAQLWGKHLGEVFPRIFGNYGKHCIVFVSKDYVSKVWTRHEFRSALTASIASNREYLLPARFDRSRLEGLDPSTSYVDLSEMSPERFAELIVKKLEHSESDSFL